MHARRLTAAVWLALVAVCIVAPVASAHPLGNTSVNIYERVDVVGDEIGMRFVMDVSEIPALDERGFADTDDDGTVDHREAETYLDGFWGYLEPRLSLVVAGRPAALERTSQELTFPPGQGGLTLMRVVFDLRAPHPAVNPDDVVEATLTETAFEGVPGWHEIVVRAGTGAALVTSDVPTEDLSEELTAYPEDRLSTPLAVRSAAFAYRVEAGAAPSPTQPASGPVTPPPPTPGPQPNRPADPLVALVGTQLTLAAALVAVAIALALGAAHALSPGHGKTLVAAYLVGTRADIRQALWLGLTVAATHTAGVFVLGVVTYAAAEWIVPDRLVSWLAVATGLLVLVLGAILVLRAQAMRRVGSRAGHGHHTQPHGADHHHAPSGVLPPALRQRDVAALGIVGGLVPSGSALLLLLSSIALDEVAFGIVLILAFGAGMAIVLVGIATGVVLLRGTPVMGWERWQDARLHRIAAMVPSISGLVVVVLGVVLTLEALSNLR